jgi:16S rRNA processing protein RimM
LVAFHGHLQVDAVNPWGGHFLAAELDALRPRVDGEVYLHELAGFAVQDKAGAPLGLVTRVVELPAGLMLEVQGPRREFLVPFRKEFVVAVNREARRLLVALPEGLADL